MSGVKLIKKLSKWEVFGSSTARTHIGAFLGHNKIARAYRIVRARWTVLTGIHQDLMLPNVRVRIVSIKRGV